MFDNLICFKFKFFGQIPCKPISNNNNVTNIMTMSPSFEVLLKLDNI